MGTFEQFKKAIVLYRSTNRLKMFTTARAVKKQYGLSGLKTAISNKLNDRPLLAGLHSRFIEPSTAPTYHARDLTDYDAIGEHIFQAQQSEYTEKEICGLIGVMAERPLISVIMPIYNPPVKWLRRAIVSLQKQHYTNWELCAVDDGSQDGRGASLIEEMAKTDARIRLLKSPQNGGISSASNQCLEMCRGEFTALLDQDDEITEDAFFWVAKTINEEQHADFIYSDECKVSGTQRHSFFFKPDWSPALMVNHMYSGHLTVYKTELIQQVGGFRSKFDFSQDYDLALRIAEMAKGIVHIERVLYFWRALPTSGSAGGKDYARTSNLAALHDWYQQKGLSVVMEMRDRANYGRIQTTSYPKVSVVIPTDSYDNLKLSIQGLLTKTSYTQLEIIPVTNSMVAERIEHEYPYLDCLNICHYNKVYNFSDKCNEGARRATGEVLIFYNDDVQPFTRDWIERLVEILAYPNVGGVSPLLIHADQTIQYAGMITGTPGMIGTSFNGIHYLEPSSNAYSHSLLRDVSILNGAVLLVKKQVFFEVGGFDALNTPNRHSDLDFSLKLLEQGYRCVYTPYAILTHIGHHSWTAKDQPDKADIYCIKRWGNYLATDRYFTESMKKMFYRDFSYLYRMYNADTPVLQQGQNGKDILFISHELSRTGAPVVLKDMVQTALADGDFPIVLSPVDGPLRREYLAMGVTVIIDESFMHGHWMFEHFARNFDLLVVNTLACGQAITLLEKSLPPVLWWVHEGSFAIHHFRSTLPRRVGKNVRVYCVGQYAREKFNELNMDCQAGILNYGVEDQAAMRVGNPKNGKVRFMVVGTYERRKGYDVFVRAVRILESTYRGQAEYVFIGHVLEDRVFEEVEQLARTNADVVILDPVPRDQLFGIYEQATCVVSPSRDDPMPVVLAEAMMLSKICICSSNTGTAAYITDGQNGFVFESENAEELARKMAFIIDNHGELNELRKQSRETYEQHFSMNVFAHNFIRVKNEWGRNPVLLPDRGSIELIDQKLH